MVDELLTNHQRVTRRQLFGRSAQGIGLAALAWLMNSDAARAAPAAGQPGLPNLPHRAAKAKHVVCLWQGGGPSHVDLFDPKPTLQKLAGQDVPESVRGTTRLSTMSSGYKKWPITPAIRPFRKYGQSGLELSELIPHTGEIADDICLV